MVEIVELEVVKVSKAARLVEEVCGLQLVKVRVKVVALRNKPKPSEAQEDPRDTVFRWAQESKVPRGKQPSLHIVICRKQYFSRHSRLQ